MSRIRFACAAWVLTGLGTAEVAGQEAKAPTWQHGMELQVRKAGETDFTKDTKKYGVEVFRDENNGNVLYISEAGQIAAVSLPAAAGGDDTVKAPTWKQAMELRCRRQDEPKFSKDTKRYGMEVFLDGNNGAVIYISELGGLAVATGTAGGKVQAPEWKHGLRLRVRKAPEEDFNKDTQTIGVEAFLDPNNGNGVYISEKGAFAVRPGGAGDPKDMVKNPSWLYGLKLGVRKAGEEGFTEKTRKHGLEVFRDENSGAAVYITEAGHLALATSGVTSPPKAKAPTWQHGMELAVRKAGEATFTKDTKKYGVEVFRDEDSGNLIYICETGSIAVVKAGPTG